MYPVCEEQMVATLTSRSHSGQWLNYNRTCLIWPKVGGGEALKLRSQGDAIGPGLRQESLRPDPLLNRAPTPHLSPVSTLRIQRGSCLLRHTAALLWMLQLPGGASGEQPQEAGGPELLLGLIPATGGL
ncbi:hypothetical protein AAFF_G00274410 [Aldrovandia affinis]|uniref:Uncharacterized protein n=1 Tax=Aldrovandia affinis TaxID=143900 RepID=A0AAD7SRN6_9TELE|nr:hypothetical protein AAFF_G00274410 [Aldrovandia affinis]